MKVQVLLFEQDVTVNQNIRPSAFIQNVFSMYKCLPRNINLTGCKVIVPMLNTSHYNIFSQNYGTLVQKKFNKSCLLLSSIF